MEQFKMKKAQSIEDLKKEGLVTTADKVSKKDNFIKAFEDTVEHIHTQTSWIFSIEAYCGEMGILPDDLIETHRLSLKMGKKGQKNEKKDHVSEDKPTKSNWFNDYRKSKTGISE